MSFFTLVLVWVAVGLALIGFGRSIAARADDSRTGADTPSQGLGRAFIQGVLDPAARPGRGTSLAVAGAILAGSGVLAVVLVVLSAFAPGDGT